MQPIHKVPSASLYSFLRAIIDGVVNSGSSELVSLASGSFSNRLLVFIILLLALLSLPANAYRSGNDIIIKRQAHHKPTLLDRKFIFMQDGAAYKKVTATSSQLTALSQVPKALPAKLTAVPPRVTKSVSKASVENIYDENNWQQWSEPIEESLAVSAKLR